jgi:HK97 family phage prohead protease
MEKLNVGWLPLNEPMGEKDNLWDLGELPEGHFRGVASVFGGVVDAQIPTIIHRGAFTKTLQEGGRKVVILWQHNDAEPIGVPVKMFETEEGLAIEARISRTTRGRDALTLMRDGVLTAMSIGFDPIKAETQTMADGSIVRHVREVRLWEVSLVTWGADPNAEIREVNSLARTESPVQQLHGMAACIGQMGVSLCIDEEGKMAEETVAALMAICEAAQALLQGVVGSTPADSEESASGSADEALALAELAMAEMLAESQECTH